MQSKHSVHIPSFHNIWTNMSLNKTYKTTFQYVYLDFVLLLNKTEPC